MNAEEREIEFDMQELVHDITWSVSLRNSRAATIRLQLAVWIMILAAWVGGVNIEIES